MTTAVDKMLLARLLGEAHALWLPLRTPGAPYWPAVWETRWLYPRRGLPWRGQGDKEQAGALAALAAAGLACPRQGQDGRSNSHGGRRSARRRAGRFRP